MNDQTLVDAIDEYKKLVSNTEARFAKEIFNLDQHNAMLCMSKLLSIHVSSMVMVQTAFMTTDTDNAFIKTCGDILREAIDVAREDFDQ